MAVGLVSAVPDPALCPFELGYNPTFNADGSILSCTKGMSSSADRGTANTILLVYSVILILLWESAGELEVLQSM